MRVKSITWSKRCIHIHRKVYIVYSIELFQETYACLVRGTMPSNKVASSEQVAAATATSVASNRSTYSRISSAAWEARSARSAARPEDDHCSSAPASGPARSRSSRRTPSSPGAVPPRSSASL